MSDLSTKAPQLSKHATALARSKAKRKKSKKGSGHDYDPRNYHQNANRHGIHALTSFDCPICQCRNTVNVELDTKNRKATVKCAHCISIRPRPLDLPYPFSTSYVPRLENKADAFFKFSERYRGFILSDQAASSTPLAPLSGDAVDHHSGDDEDDKAYGGGKAGILGGLGALAGSGSDSEEESDDSREGSGSKRSEAEGSEVDAEGQPSGEGEDEVVDDVDGFFNSDSD